MASCHAKTRMLSLPRAGLFRYTGQREESSPPQRSVSVLCRAEVIISHAPSTLQACETHVTGRREVYCPPSPSALLTYGSDQTCPSRQLGTIWVVRYR